MKIKTVAELTERGIRELSRMMEMVYIVFWTVNTYSCPNVIEMKMCAAYCSLIIPHF